MRADVEKLDTHSYRLNVKAVTDSGIKEIATQDILLCRGSKLGEGIERQDGFFTEQLLDVCREYLESVNQGDLKNKYATMAIGNIQQAMYWLEERQKDRQERGVAQTYKK